MNWLKIDHLLFTLLLTLGAPWFASSQTRADILVTGFFNGTIVRIDEQSKVQTTFAAIPGNPGLSGIAFDPTTNRVFVSALNQGGVYALDATTGLVTNFYLLGYGPGGLTVDSVGNVYVTDFTSNLVRVYDPTFAGGLPISTISVPASATSGVGLLSSGDVLVATPGTGVYRYDGVSAVPFTTSPLAPLASSQIAEDSAGRIFIGHGVGFSDFVFVFDSSGNLIGTLEVTDAMVQGTGQGSSLGTSPSGVVVDRDGNLIVAALGRSNPGDPGGERGGVFKFSPTGTLIDTFVSGSSAFSSAAIIPTPHVVEAFVYHNGWAGVGSPKDSSKFLQLETTTAETLSYDNLINTSDGINGLGFLIEGLGNPAGLTIDDFEFQVSPDGAFVPGKHPPASWGSGPSPSSIAVTGGSTSEVLLIWPDGQIVNRWLRVTVKATVNTGLSIPKIYYVGHLLGEVSGLSNDIYTVTFSDILLIRNEVGSAGFSSNNIYDINKNGSVSFADITDMRTAVGSQLSNISVP